MKSFEIPEIYKSGLIGKIKISRRLADKLKKDFEPTILDFGPVRFLIARHFGFCYGVENAIEIAYKAIEENEDKRIYLLSEMIHNPEVNADLLSAGVKFIMDTNGNQIIPWEFISENDIVIVPAFGTTIEIQSILKAKGINPYLYDTTCPFVEKVWKKANQIGRGQYTVIVHGKPNHEETRATASHSKEAAPTLVIQNMEEAVLLAKFMKGQLPTSHFQKTFEGRFSDGFDPEKDLNKLGVVNQTTMLASETQAISDYLKKVIVEKNKLTKENTTDYFADTRDTLCYATNDNQNATLALIQHQADLAIVAGGYNSSNTSHLVELCEEKLPTYFIESKDKIVDATTILHYNLHEKREIETTGFLPPKDKLNIILTCGASCPDSVVEGILQKLLSFFENTKTHEQVLEEINAY
ncbi:MAG: 4-hydroxy-3-methylbut-2-enyl diphosphate reductase [Bacteroidota bacterium]